MTSILSRPDCLKFSAKLCFNANIPLVMLVPAKWPRNPARTITLKEAVAVADGVFAVTVTRFEFEVKKTCVCIAVVVEKGNV